MSWTPERVEKLRKLWADGLSCSQIANELGHTSRNAVIGKAHRIGLPQRTLNKIERKPYERRTVERRRPRAALPPVSAYQRWIDKAEPAEAPTGPLVAFMDLEFHHCRFAPGEPSEGFCGAPKVIGLSYCAHHAMRCYTPPKPRAERQGGRPDTMSWLPNGHRGHVVDIRKLETT